MTMHGLKLWCATLVLLGTACGGGGSPAVERGGTGGGQAGTGGGSASPSGGSAGTGGGPTGDGGACAPQACGARCGSVSDGCGHTLDCGACGCTTAADCPSRPCEVASACSAGACLYQPVTCNFAACTACQAGADGGCADTDQRGCGPGCADSYCEPSPSQVGGRTVYANTCVARTDVRCGTCELGGLVCAADGGQPAVCRGITLTGVNPAFVECNGASPSATLLFVDPASTSGTHTGAKESPFLTFDEAASAAALRSSRAIILGGSPTFNEALVVSSGVSVLGGFAGYPTWVRDDARRPTFAVPASAVADGRLVGLLATNATVPTEVANLDIVTPDLPGTGTAEGASNVGAQVQASTALALSRVHLRVGAGQAGGAGAPGTTQPGTVPATASGTDGLAAGPNVLCAGAPWTSVPGGAGAAPSCGGQALPAAAGGSGGTVGKACAAFCAGGVNNLFYTRGSDSPGGADGGLASGTPSIIGGQGGAGFTPAGTPDAGVDAAPSLVFTNGLLRAQGRGSAGAPGRPGVGGGGGSGGISWENWPTEGPYCITGGGGGAGGAGGCPGLGGTGGYPGGWSIGLAASGSSSLILTGVTVTVSAGGPGGPGGAGGPGAPGADGGAGGGYPPYGWFGSSFTGAAGGQGGTGQAGGPGGAGARGLTRAAACDAPGLDLSGLDATQADGGAALPEGC